MLGSELFGFVTAVVLRDGIGGGVERGVGGGGSFGGVCVVASRVGSLRVGDGACAGAVLEEDAKERL